jgi:hypothetical protein
VIAVFLKVLAQNKKTSFSLLSCGNGCSGKVVEALQNYYEALQIEEDPYDRSYTPI